MQNCRSAASTRDAARNARLRLLLLNCFRSRDSHNLRYESRERTDEDFVQALIKRNCARVLGSKGFDGPIKWSCLARV